MKSIRSWDTVSRYQLIRKLDDSVWKVEANIETADSSLVAALLFKENVITSLVWIAVSRYLWKN